jgi:hypothetical protein
MKSDNHYKNGNVKTQSMYGAYRDQFANTNDLEFAFTYDKSNRLENVYNTYSSDGSYDLYNTYDYDGNLLSLRRFDADTSSTARPTKTATRYYYDEAGNRVRKLTYQNTQTNPGPVTWKRFILNNLIQTKSHQNFLRWLFAIEISNQ